MADRPLGAAVVALASIPGRWWRGGLGHRESQELVKVFPVERFRPAVAWRMLLLRARETAYGSWRWRPATQAESLEISLVSTSIRIDATG
jgi:hypothetical protein